MRECNRTVWIHTFIPGTPFRPATAVREVVSWLSGRSEEQTDNLCMKTSSKKNPPKSVCGMDAEYMISRLFPHILRFCSINLVKLVVNWRALAEQQPWHAAATWTGCGGCFGNLEVI